MIRRRTLLTGAAAAAALAGCLGPSGPGALTVSAQGAADANTGPDGDPRPLTLTVVQLTSPDAFESADFFALQDPQTSLGSTLLQADQLVLAPGASVSRVIGLEEGVEVIGVIAGFRSPAGKSFRATTAAPASGDAGLVISVSGSGIALQPA